MWRDSRISEDGDRDSKQNVETESPEVDSPVSEKPKENPVIPEVNSSVFSKKRVQRLATIGSGMTSHSVLVTRLRHTDISDSMKDIAEKRSDQLDFINTNESEKKSEGPPAYQDKTEARSVQSEMTCANLEKRSDSKKDIRPDHSNSQRDKSEKRSHPRKSSRRREEESCGEDPGKNHSKSGSSHKSSHRSSRKKSHKSDRKHRAEDGAKKSKSPKEMQLKIQGGDMTLCNNWDVTRESRERKYTNGSPIEK